MSVRLARAGTVGLPLNEVVLEHGSHACRCSVALHAEDDKLGAEQCCCVSAHDVGAGDGTHARGKRNLTVGSVALCHVAAADEVVVAAAGEHYARNGCKEKSKVFHNCY